MAPFSHNTFVTDGQTDGQMDRRQLILTARLLLKYGQKSKAYDIISTTS